MAQHIRFVSYLLGIVLLVIPSLEATPRFWPWQTKGSPSSIVTISIGDRVNTNAGLDDRGTSIRDLTINLSRWSGNLTFARNGTDVFVTRGKDGITNIRIAFDSNTTTQLTSTNSTNSTPASNSTQSSNRRRKRAAGVPSLPAFPIPTLNGSRAFLDGNYIPLPSAISSLASTDSFLQPWQFIQTFINRRLPMLALDAVVSFLSQLYSSTGNRLIDTGVNALGEITDSFSGVVNSGLDLTTEQASSGIQGVVRSYNDLTRAGQTCVGDVPEDSARRVVSKATGCVRQRWNEVEEIVNQFLEVISDTEEAYGGWLRVLDECNARNFAGLSESQLDAAQRKCYIQAIADSVGKMVDIPMRWANLTLRTSNAVMNFQPQVGLCVAGVGAEVASVSANIGLRIVLCQLFQ